MVNQAAIKKALFLHEAERWKGVTEVGGDNKGELVSLFQKAVDGKAKGEAWCMAWVMFCALEVDSIYEKCLAEPLMDSSIPMMLFKAEHCLTVWNRSPPEAKIFNPAPGDIIIWQFYKNGLASASGHVGIVKKIIDADKLITIEGNTSSLVPGIDRDGNGIYEKIRRYKTNSKDTMQVKGFLRLWK